MSFFNREKKVEQLKIKDFSKANAFLNTLYDRQYKGFRTVVTKEINGFFVYVKQIGEDKKHTYDVVMFLDRESAIEHAVQYYFNKVKEH